MIKVPDIRSPKYHGPLRDDEGFDPTRDDWSRHGGESSGSKPDGVGYLDDEEDDAVPSWFEPESDLDEGHDQPLHRAA